MRRIGYLVFRIVLLPFWLAARLIGLLFGGPTGRLTRRFDSSPFFSRLINRISSSMATQRGLLLLLGTGLLVLSLLVHAIVIIALVSSDRYERSLYWLCLPSVILHLGILVGFTGVMLATPLGQGYQDK